MAILESTPTEYLVNRAVSVQISGVLASESTVPWETDSNRHPQGTILGKSSNDGTYHAVKSSLIDGDATSGATDIPVADTTPFAVGDTVTLYDVSAGTSETATVASITDGVKLVAAANLSADYAANDYCYVAGSYSEEVAVAVLDTETLNRNEQGAAEDTPCIVTAWGILKSGVLPKVNAREVAALTAAGFNFVEVD